MEKVELTKAQITKIEKLNDHKITEILASELREDGTIGVVYRWNDGKITRPGKAVLQPEETKAAAKKEETKKETKKA